MIGEIVLWAGAYFIINSCVNVVEKIFGLREKNADNSDRNAKMPEDGGSKN